MIKQGSHILRQIAKKNGHSDRAALISFDPQISADKIGRLHSRETRTERELRDRIERNKKEEGMTAENKKQIELLTELFASFKNGLLVKKSVGPRSFVEQLGLDHYKIEMGYNSSQFHHSKPAAFKKAYLELGVLIPSNAATNAPDRVAYSSVGKEGIIFPLRNKQDEIINYAGYRFKLNTPKWEHLNEEGLYPGFPHEDTERLFICTNEIEAATLLQSGVLEKKDAILALRDGEVTDLILQTIQSLGCLNTIVLQQHQHQRQNDAFSLQVDLEDLEGVNIVKLKLPEDETSINDFWQKYGSDALLEIIMEAEETQITEAKTNTKKETEVPKTSKLILISEGEFQYEGEELSYTIKGPIPANNTLLDMHFEIFSPSEGFLRTRLDLMDSASVEAKLFEWTENSSINYATAILEINAITKELENLRKLKKEGKQLPVKGFSVKQDTEAKKILEHKDLFLKLDKLIEKAGIVGEESSRLLLFLIASSYKFKYNLHAVIQTDQREAGAEFVKKIAALIPELDRYELDLTSSRTFRYYGKTINNKLLVIQEYKGITESKAIKDLKRLQAKGMLVNDTPKKGANGLLFTTKQEVKGHTSSIGACDKSKRYFENEPRTVLVGMDTSPEQAQRLMQHDCMLMAGLIDEKEQDAAKELLQYIVKNIFSQEVVNPFAAELMLPVEIPNARTLTMQLMNFVNIVTLFKQHQRKMDGQGRVIAEKEDIQIATDLFLEAIVVNIDEIDATTRYFFDQLKTLFLKQPKAKKTTMSSLEIRQQLNMSKTTVNRLLRTLVEFEYVKKEGYKNTGYTYRIAFWNGVEEIKKSLKLGTTKFTNGDSGEPNPLGHQNP